MKKFLALLLMSMFAVTLVACGSDLTTDLPTTEAPTTQAPTTQAPTTTGDTTPPVLDGVTDVEIYVDSTFDVLEGVTATDDVDGDITSEIEVTGTVNTASAGTYFLRYSVSDAAGNVTEDTRYVTVVFDPSLIGDEMVPNGDFSLGWNIWTTTTGLEGGMANFSVVNEELVIEITGVSGGMWEPRLENQGITFENGKYYRVTFDARALAPRAIHVQVGELLPSAPWFDNFKPANSDVIDLTTTMETYSLTFVMNHDTNENGSLIFEFGTIAGTVGTDNLLTTVYLDNVMIEEIAPIADTDAPVINGADAKDVTIGDVFDPLEGVTVVDAIDGEIIITLANVTGTVDTDTLGEYTLTYTVQDAALNELVHTRIITVVEDTSPPEITAEYGWRSFLNDWAGTAGELNAVEGQLVLDLTAINADAGWNIQIIQDAYALGTGADNEGSIQFVAGETYRVTFDAMASVAGNIDVAIGNSVDGWLAYHLETIAVTTEMATYTFEFTLDDATVDYTNLAQFKLEMGLLFAGQTAPQSFTLDNVGIEIYDAVTMVYSDAELIVNGNFDPVEKEVTSAVDWRAFTNSWEGTVGGLSVVNGELVFDLEVLNAIDAAWKLQIIQDAYALGTGADNEGSMQFEAGKTYRVTFDAMASVAGDINVAIGYSIPEWTEYHLEIVSVTTKMTTYSFIFTLDDATMDYTTLAQFKLELGLLFAGQTAPQSFTLDNVGIEVLDATTSEYVDAELIVNGDFTPVIAQAVDWRAFTNNWEGTVGDIRVVNGELVFDLEVLNAIDAAWKLQIIQDAYALGTGEDNVGSMQFEAGKTYRVTFDAMASVAGNINVAIGHSVGGWTEYHLEIVSVTTDMATYSFIFTLDDATMDYTTLAQFKLEMGLLFAGLEGPQQFVLDNVTIEVHDAVTDTYSDAGLVESGDFTPTITSAQGWRGFTNNWEGTYGELFAMNGQLVFDLQVLNNLTDNWKIQVIQDAYALGTGADNEGSIQFVAGETYRVTFEAMASVAGDINLAIGHAGGGWTEYYAEIITITNEMTLYTVVFTLDDATMDYTTLAQFKLEMGLLFAGQEVPQQFRLDNVVIEIYDAVAETYSDTGLIVNGDFEFVDATTTE